MSIVSALLITAGLFFFAVGTLGLLRFPDFYTRLHAAGKCDSFASVLVAAGVACYALGDFSFGNFLVFVKILFIAVLVFVASPTATHAVTEAALIVGVEPWSKEKKKK